MHRKYNNGFILVSYVVYATILVLLMGVSAQLAVLIIPRVYALMEWCNLTDFYTAYDLLYKDLCCAPKRAKDWYKADQEGLIWHTDLYDHGWLIVQNNLVFKEGTYDVNSGNWSHVTTSLIAHNVNIDNVILSQEGEVIKEIVCSMRKVHATEHRWCCKKVFL